MSFLRRLLARYESRKSGSARKSRGRAPGRRPSAPGRRPSAPGRRSPRTVSAVRAWATPVPGYGDDYRPVRGSALRPGSYVAVYDGAPRGRRCPARRSFSDDGYVPVYGAP